MFKALAVIPALDARSAAALADSSTFFLQITSAAVAAPTTATSGSATGAIAASAGATPPSIGKSVGIILAILRAVPPTFMAVAAAPAGIILAPTIIAPPAIPMPMPIPIPLIAPIPVILPTPPRTAPVYLCPRLGLEALVCLLTAIARPILLPTVLLSMEFLPDLASLSFA